MKAITYRFFHLIQHIEYNLSCNLDRCMYTHTCTYMYIHCSKAWCFSSPNYKFQLYYWMSKQITSVVPYTLISFHHEPTAWNCKYYHIHVTDTDNYCSGELQSLQQGVGSLPPTFGSFHSWSSFAVVSSCKSHEIYIVSSMHCLSIVYPNPNPNLI